MNLKEYQPLARRTMKEMPFELHMEHMGLGVIGELGEFADAVKKFFVYGKGVGPDGRPLAAAEGGLLDTVNLMEEGGDCFWYVMGYLPELELDAAWLQKSFDAGFERGRAYSGTCNSLVLAVMARMAHATTDLMTQDIQPLPIRAGALSIMCRDLGQLYGRFGLDLAQSLDRNIAKLTKRYGDRYSDVAALNRDVAAERVVLETPVNVYKGRAVGASEPTKK